MAVPSSFRHQVLYENLSSSDDSQALRILRTRLEGLMTQESRDRLKRDGPNEIAQESYHWHRQLARASLNPFIILLCVLALVSFLTDDLPGGLVMTVMVILSVGLTFIQEFRSSKAAEKLKSLVSTNATVSRVTGFVDIGGGQSEQPIFKKVEIPVREIAQGDIIHLSAGDMLPADVRLLSSRDLYISQSSLTGESLPVEKTAKRSGSDPQPLIERANLCFLGSNVVSGTATAVVMKTGGATYVGALAMRISGHRPPSSFDKGIQRFTWLMLKFMAVMVPAVFLINGFTKGNWYEAFMFAIAVAVGLTPEMLPMIVTVNLAKGALAMSKKKVIVKRLNAIQNFGAMDVLCTDKTGTLTEDNVVLERYVDALGNQNPRVLKYAYLNSFHQTGLKNLLDVAVLRHVELRGELDFRNFRKLDELPFDFNRKRMSVIVERTGSLEKRHILICKGALEEIFQLSSHAEINNERVDIDAVSATECYKIAQAMNDEGLRVIAVAYKDIPFARTDYTVSDECNLTLLGYIAFLDPAKPTTQAAIEALNRQGVQIKVLTGDNDRVTRTICRQVGLDVTNLLLGSQIETMSDELLDAAVQKVTVFAKLNPIQKERIVLSLQKAGHVVGFMGDGINDAAALKAADVGISVENAVDVAKESADIILLEKSLLVLEDGVIEGRKVFGNIVKYIKMGASSNFGNVFSILGSSSLLPFLPMKPVQLLTQNLLYDISQTTIPLDNVDPEYLEKPRKWEIGDIAKFMAVIGPISSLFDYLTFALMWFVFKANHPGQQSLFQTGWFVEGLLSQTLVVHIIRTQKIPFFQSRASWPLMFTTITIIAIGIYIPFSSFGLSIGLQPLPLAYFPWLVGMLVTYCLLTQFVKTWFIRRFGFR